MKIKIISMHIENFKGIKDKIIPFDPDNTVLCGRNETGKTTVADAFFWLLFGKDSNFRSKFDIIPLNKENEAIHHLLTSVEVQLQVDTETHILKRVLSENWVKKHGVDTEKELTGTSTGYFINETPAKKSEFTDFITAIISESDFKLLTSTSYFNDILNWEDRREILTGLIKDYSFEDLVQQKGFALIKEEIQKSGIVKIEEKYKFQKKELVKLIDDIPPRIDEVSKTIDSDEVAGQGVEGYQLRRDGLKEKIEDLQKKSNNNFITTQADLSKRLKKAKADLEDSNVDTTYIDSTKETLKQMKEEQSTLTTEITDLSKEFKDSENRLVNMKENQGDLKNKYLEQADLTFPEDSRVCSFCGQHLPADKLNEVKANFKKIREQTMADLTRQAGLVKSAIAKLVLDSQKVTEQIEGKKKKLETLPASISELDKNINSYKNELDAPTVESDLINRVSNLKKELSELTPDPETDQMKIYQVEIDEISSKIGSFEGSEKAKVRLEELKIGLKEKTEQLLGVEKRLNLIDKLKIKYIEAIEGDINNLFDRKIKVRLFEKQVNGGFKEACDILVLNRVGALVPWQFVNTAGQINSSLQIINQLSKHKNIFCPVFIDHSESVETIFEMDTQTIELKFFSTYSEITVK